MGIREDVLEAARSLTERGTPLFSPAELIAAARSAGSTYADASLRTHVVSYMCKNAGGAYGGRYPDLLRVGRGLYRLAEAAPSDRASRRRPTGRQRPLRVVTDQPRPTHQEDWFSEANVQAAVVRHLVASGWRLLRVADTASREHGVDVEAERSGERLLAEVKGYPGTAYARGDRKGMPKSTRAAAQARQYFSHALLAGLLIRSDWPTARVVLAFPAMPTFTNLAARVAQPLRSSGIEVWLVHIGDRVTEQITG